MSTDKSVAGFGHILEGGASPVFWGSFFGILVSSFMAGLSHLGVVGTELRSDTMESTFIVPNPIVVIFCCLLCIRYYASIIFLSYDDVTSPMVLNLERRARRTIFGVQLFLIVGCSLNIAILAIFGAGAATVVILIQAVSVVPYWWYVWDILITGAEYNFRMLLVLGDVVILVSAATFLTWELGWFPYDETGAGMCMGAILFIFVGEAITNYRKSFVILLLRTRDTLR